MSLALLTIDDLARVLHRSRETVKKDCSQAPWKLPPRVRLPGSRIPLWRSEDVTRWIENHLEKEHEQI
jgi:predicted DNA-binding transcriptional regulator AlpA